MSNSLPIKFPYAGIPVHHEDDDPVARALVDLSLKLHATSAIIKILRELITQQGDSSATFVKQALNKHTNLRDMLETYHNQTGLVFMDAQSTCEDLLEVLSAGKTQAFIDEVKLVTERLVREGKLSRVMEAMGVRKVLRWRSVMERSRWRNTMKRSRWRSTMEPLRWKIVDQNLMLWSSALTILACGSMLACDGR